MTDDIVDKQYEESKSSRPVIEREFILYSEQAQRVYRRNFQQVDNNAFSISVISRAHGNYSQAALAEKNIKSQLAQNGEKLDLESSRIKVLRDKIGLDDQGFMSNPLSVKARLSANLSMEFLQLLTKMDDFLCLFEPLVILGEIDYDQRQAITFDWQKRMTKLCAVIRTYAEDLRSLHKGQQEKTSASDDKSQ